MEPHAHRRTRDGRQLILPGLVTAAGLAWAAVIAVDAFNLPEHVWHCMLAIAAVATNGCLLYLVIMQLDKMNDRLERGYQAMVAHRDARPYDARTPGPWPGLQPGDVPRMRVVQNGSRR